MQRRFKCNPKPRAPRGLTLMEVLITLALLSVIFGIGADLLQGASKAIRVQNQKGQAGQALQLAMARICNEVRQCQNITAADASQLELLVVDPNYPTGPQPKDPYNPQNRFIVRYTTDGQGNLMRAIRRESGGATDNQLVAEGIQGISCSWNPGTLPGVLSVALSVNDENIGVRALKCEVFPMAVRP